MLLAIDVGNTQSVIGVYDGDTLKHMWRLSTTTVMSSDELHIKLQGLFDLVDLDRHRIDSIALATVVPGLIHNWKKVGYDMFGLKVLVVNVHTAGDLIDVSAYRRTDIGADRVADVVAARAIYGSPVVVVDFGTATNMEVVDAEGRFLGGIIAPGVKSSMDALFSRTALLPEVELVDPRKAIGRNTVKAIQVGIVYGEADRVDGLVGRIFDELGYEAPVVATGGLARTISPLCSRITDIDPELTLRGLHMIADDYTRRNAESE